MNSVLVSRRRYWLDFKVGIELTWSQCWCRNELAVCVTDRILLGVSAGIESNLFFVLGIEIDRLCVEINWF